MIILIVDDSKLNRVYAKNFVENSTIEAEILLAADGQEALDILNSNTIDVVLLDIVMPVMNGLETLKQIRLNKSWDHVKVLMYSSITEQEMLRACFELGASDFIHKPIEEVEFISRLRNAIRQKNNELALKNYIEEIEKQKSIIMETNVHLIQAEKMAAIGQLAAGVAHEINNPIGFVLSNFEVLKDYMKDLYEFYERSVFLNHHQSEITQDDEEDINEVFEDIANIFEETKIGLDRVTQIVKSLRNFSRIDLTQELDYYDLNEGLKDTLIVANNNIKYNAYVNVEYGDIPQIMAIGSEINQVILNLVLNAVDSIREKNGNEMGHLYLKTYKKNNYIVLSVLDYGIGIADEHIKDLFNPFFTTKDVGQGMGLGLSVSYDIVVNKHKGKFEVESDEESGTEFRMYLPIE
ncbi:MAG: response regulator [Clostridia bacterium]|nr:response regulator [Clostridia bacterium]